jgi:L-alanine-DL-glutamate epimerase-like enolase superfamily enzyme
MRVVDIRETVVPIRSSIRNAYIDFSKMTASLVAVTLEAEGGRRATGFGFNSNGRYAPQGLLRERFIPRLREADPEALLGADGALDPVRAWDAIMTGEKPGGHGERSVAVGVLDMALWDAVAKARDLPLWRLLADRFGDGEPDRRVFVYAAGGYYQPEKGVEGLREEFRRYLGQGYTHCKMKIGGASLADDLRRIDAALEVVGDPARLAVDANGRFDLAEALAYAEALRPYGLFWYEEAGDPLDFRARWPPARTCSRIRTPATCCAMGGCGPTGTGCSSTAR